MADGVLPILVAAYGNEWAADDAFGLLVADALREMAPPGVEVVSLGMRPASLLEYLAHRSALCVVDAARCDDLPVGTLLEVDFFDVHRPQLVHDTSLSTHGLSVADELELARRLEICPQVVWLVAAVAGCLEIGRSAGEEVLRQVPVAAGHIAQWGTKLLEGPRP
ncbi:MAG: hydrogenase maturation protease [Pirellulaceae bacterium]